MCENFQGCQESYQIVWNVFRLSGNFQGCLKTFQVVWNVFSLSVSFTYCLKNFPHCLETFQINCKLSQLSGKFTDYLERLQVVCKLSKIYVRFPYCLELSHKVNMMWTFLLSRHNCFGSRAFQSFRPPQFLFVHTLYFNYAPFIYLFTHFLCRKIWIYAKVCSPESCQLFCFWLQDIK